MARRAPVSEPAPGPGLSQRRRLGFTVAMALLPVLFFVALEGVLRLGGYGQALPLFVELERPAGYLYQNREVARRYFHQQVAVPTSLLDFFPQQKGGETFRIFVQGGSTAAGYPYYYGGAFSRMLEERLQQTFPERRIEVVNTAMAAVNSYTLLDFADEIVAQQPDAVLIYAGHNEFYGALGVGSVESLGRHPALVRLYLRLQPLRTVQLLRYLLARVVAAGRTGGEARGTTLMARIVGEQTIPYGSALYHAGHAQFASNLRALLARYRRAGVPVLVGTVASNERHQPPFVSVQEGDSAAWHARLDTAVRAARHAGDLEPLRALVAEDSLDARSRYHLAQALDARGDTSAARHLYAAARDRDALRFRAASEVNAILRAVAAEEGAVVVETEAALRHHSPGGIIGREMMLEHLHPTVAGSFVLADAFYEALRTHGLIGDWAGYVPAARARADVLLTPVDSIVGRYRVLQLEAAWPFQPVGVRLPYLDTLRARGPLDSLAQKLFLNEIGWDEANRQQQRHFEAQGQVAEAARVARARHQESPFDESGLVAAGNLMLQAGRLGEALVHFQRASRVRETSAARGVEGAILLEQGQTATAVAVLERAVALDDANVRARYNLAGGYGRLGRHAEALAAIEEVLSRQPGYPGAEAVKQQLLTLTR